jgi:ABC-2 type transport system permease protein
MWFKSIYLKTLRDYRVAIIAWGLGMGGLVTATLTSFHSLLETPQAAEGLLKMAPSFNWYAEPVAITTPAGFIFWKLGPLILALCIWALLAGSRTLRGEEDRGALDVLLTLPRGRMRVALEKLAALGTALLLIAVLTGLVVFAGGQRVNGGFGLGAALLFGFNIALIAALFAALALLIGQFTRQRGVAAGITGALLVIFFAMDSTGRTFAGASWLSKLSPVYYFNRSKPLISSYGTSPGAMLLLAALTVGLSAIAIRIFTRRDLGAPAIAFRLFARAKSPSAHVTADSWSLRSVYLRSLRTTAASGRWWALGIAVFGGWMTSLLKQLETNLTEMVSNSPEYSRLIAAMAGGGGSLSTNLLSVYFLLIVLLLTVFAVTQANRWATDEEDGRLDLVLATSQPRHRVILANFAALATVILGIALVTLAAIALATAATGFGLDGGHLVAATLGMVPLALVVAITGYLLAGWLHAGAATAILGTLVGVSFVLGFLGSALEWPAGVIQLSLFHQYGTPLLSGPPWGSLFGLLAGTAVALGLATMRFTRKDIAR